MFIGSAVHEIMCTFARFHARSTCMLCTRSQSFAPPEESAPLWIRESAPPGIRKSGVPVVGDPVRESKDSGSRARVQGSGSEDPRLLPMTEFLPHTGLPLSARIWDCPPPVGVWGPGARESKFRETGPNSGIQDHTGVEIHGLGTLESGAQSLGIWESISTSDATPLPQDKIVLCSSLLPLNKMLRRALARAVPKISRSPPRTQSKRNKTLAACAASCSSLVPSAF